MPSDVVLNSVSVPQTITTFILSTDVFFELYKFLCAFASCTLSSGLSVNTPGQHTHPHTHFLSLPPGQRAVFSAVKSVTVQWQFDHVWTAGCWTAAAVGQRLPLAAWPGQGGSDHLRDQRSSAGNLTH